MAIDRTPPPSAPEPSCARCGGAGYFVLAVPQWHPQFAVPQPCDCPAYTAWQRGGRRAAALARLESDLGALAHCRLATFDPERPPADMAPAERRSLRQALGACRAYLAAPGGAWLYLFGPYGSGKSHLAAAVAWELAAQERDVYYRCVPDLVDDVRAGYRAGDYDARLAAIKDVAVLVLDDIDAESDGESTQTLLYQIINHRANRPDLLTLLTSNTPLDALARKHGRIASRIGGRARIVPVVASDYRVLQRPR